MKDEMGVSRRKRERKGKRRGENRGMGSKKKTMKEKDEKRGSGEGRRARIRYIGNGMEEFKIVLECDRP